MVSVWQRIVLRRRSLVARSGRSNSRELKDGDEVFKERTSLVFKTMQVVRFLDKKRNTLVYLVYSDRLIEGSPQNAVTAIPILPWVPVQQ